MYFDEQDRTFLTLIKQHYNLTSDAAAVQKAEAALEADAAALSKTDWTAGETATKALFQPLIDAYNRDMKIAAGN